MAKKKQGRLHQLLELLLYPLNWLEERTSIPGHSGLIGGIKYFLFRKVPSDISWGHTLGSAALTVSAAKALSLLAGRRLSPAQLADVAFRAEYHQVGVRCGRMDQTIAAQGQRGTALLFETADGSLQRVSFPGRLW